MGDVADRQLLPAVGAGQLPAEGPGGGVVVLLEGEDLGSKLVEVFEVVGGEQSASAQLRGPFSTTQKTRLAEAYGSVLMTWSTSAVAQRGGPAVRAQGTASPAIVFSPMRSKGSTRSIASSRDLRSADPV
jgi:hypothetical protein